MGFRPSPHRAEWILGVFLLTGATRASDQPIAYSHKRHLALGLDCLDCHSTADTGSAASIPSVRKCMLCHARIAADKPEIRKVAAYARRNREIPWRRVYGFPREAAASIAIATTRAHLGAHALPQSVIFVCFDAATRAAYEVALAT